MQVLLHRHPETPLRRPFLAAYQARCSPLWSHQPALRQLRFQSPSRLRYFETLVEHWISITRSATAHPRQEPSPGSPPSTLLDQRPMSDSEPMVQRSPAAFSSTAPSRRIALTDQARALEPRWLPHFKRRIRQKSSPASPRM